MAIYDRQPLKTLRTDQHFFMYCFFTFVGVTRGQMIIRFVAVVLAGHLPQPFSQSWTLTMVLVTVNFRSLIYLSKWSSFLSHPHTLSYEKFGLGSEKTCLRGAGIRIYTEGARFKDYRGGLFPMIHFWLSISQHFTCQNSASFLFPKLFILAPFHSILLVFEFLEVLHFQNY